MSVASLERSFFTFSRELEYFDLRELMAQTSQPSEMFPLVVVKELLDNAIDSCEETKKVPSIELNVNTTENEYEIMVKDNGNGLSKDVLDRILDFNIRGSSKVYYNTPTRGQMGNALKTIFGIPVVLSKKRAYEKPIIIKSLGRRYTINIRTDPTNEIFIDNNDESEDITEGTSFSVTMPNKKNIISDIIQLFIHYGIFNPHINLTGTINGEVFGYKAVTDDKWRKFKSSDLPSPHWYNKQEFEKLVYAEAKFNNRPFGEFIRQFKGLSSVRKAKEIAGNFPEFKYVMDITGEELRLLLDIMKKQTKPPSPDLLGVIGKEFLSFRLHELGDIGQLWYKKKAGFHKKDGREIPFVIEGILGINEKSEDEDGSSPSIITGLNFSPTYSDPFKNTYFYGGYYISHGLASSLRELEIKNYDNAIFILHLTSPVLEFTQRDKSTLTIGDELREEVRKVIYGCCKELYEKRSKENGKIERERKKGRREREEFEKEKKKAQQISLKDAIFEVLPEALDKVSKGRTLPFSNRQLFYQVRPLIQPYTAKELKSGYLAGILSEYQKNHGKIEGIYYEPRGDFYEPHTSEKIPLGTREVAEYSIPEYLFNKILYVEKRGFMPLFDRVNLREKYDMGIAASQGYAVEACKDLLAKTANSSEPIPILILHDCDVDGLMIAKNLKERLNDYPIKVIDIGLFVNEVVERNLEAEKTTLKKRLPEQLKNTLTDEEKNFLLNTSDYGYKEGKRIWHGKRVELNALTSEELINYIEDKLREHGLTKKVCPPDDIIEDTIDNILDDEMDSRVQNVVVSKLDVRNIVSKIKKQLIEKVDLSNIPEDLKKKLRDNPIDRWRNIIERRVSSRIFDVITQHEDLIKDQIYKNLDFEKEDL